MWKANLTQRQHRKVDKFVDEIVNYYNLFNWEWFEETSGFSVPTKAKIKSTILHLIDSASKFDGWSSTGGITVEIGEEDDLSIKWSKDVTLYL